jgi:protein-S-isoprenylcysteine O-methyltransferase Ste14
MNTLDAQAWRALVRLTAFMALLLFVPAGTLHYWQAWVYLAVFIGASTLITIDLMRRDRALLARRLEGGASAEKEPIQKIIMLLAAIAFAALLAVPALDHRFRYSDIPVTAVALGDVMALIGFCVVARVYRENSFTSATVYVAESQTLISTGPYAIVRHPMYMGVALFLLGTPFALASYWAFPPMALLLGLMIWRLLDEERMLAGNLPGYIEYQRQVRYRLLPLVW